MLGRRRREGNHGFLSCSRLLNCLPKLNDCKTNTSICYRLGFVIYKQCLLEAVTVYNLIAVTYFLEKEGIHQKQVMVRLCTKIWTRSNGRKEPPLPSEKQSLIYKVEGLLLSLGKAPKAGKWLKFTESFACYAIYSAVTGISEELAFLLGFCTFFLRSVPHHFS